MLGMPWYELVVGGLIMVVAIIEIICVVLQKSDEDGVNAFSGSVSNPGNRAQTRGLEGKLPKLTVIFGITLAVLCIGLVVMIRFIPVAA